MTEDQQQSAAGSSGTPSSRSLAYPPAGRPSLKYFPKVKPVSRRLIVSSFVLFWLGGLFLLGGGILLFFGAMNQSSLERKAFWQYNVRVEQNCPVRDGGEAGESAVAAPSVSDRSAAADDGQHKITQRRIIQGKKTHHSGMAPEALPYMIAGLSLVMLGALLPLFYFIVSLVVLYRGWKCVQPLRVISPEKVLNMPSAGGAVGLLFVPFFSFYWIFRAYCDVSRYGRELSESSGRPYRGPSSDLSVTFPIIHLSSLLLGIFAMVAESIVLYFYTIRLNDMVADLGGLPEAVAE